MKSCISCRVISFSHSGIECSLGTVVTLKRIQKNGYLWLENSIVGNCNQNIANHSMDG
jgi:hypothetical protein